MARPRTPTKILKALGSFAKDPKRAREREDEPEVAGKLGKPPAAFLRVSPEPGYQEAARLRKIWRQVARDAPWLDRGNRMVVEQLCRSTDAANEAYRLKLKSYPALANVQRGLMSDLGIPQAQRSKVKLDDLNDAISMSEGSVRMNLEIDL